jgi:uncharacterized protein YdaU (DUF1376 family)
MKTPRPPAFQFYPKDFLSDGVVSRMSATATGCYIRLLCHCWLEGGMPNDLKEIKKLARYDGSRWGSVWRQCREAFVLHAGTTWVQPRLEEERAKQAEFRAKKQKAGLAGGKQKASNALANQLAKPTSSSSSSVQEERTKKERTGAAPPPENSRTVENLLKTPKPATRLSRALLVVTRLVHEAWDRGSGNGTLTEDVKKLCAQHHIPYDSALVGRAIDSARVQRQRKGKPAP